VHTAAARLVSPAGRRFAGALVTGAEPRTWVEEVPDQQFFDGRRVAMLDAPGLPPEVADPRPAFQRARIAHAYDLALWPMVTPSHREVAAAHIQPYLGSTVDQARVRAFEGLAAADGPPGPAMSVLLAYAFGARREALRLAAGDALIALAARPDWDSTGIGAEIGVLAAADRLVLQRTVQPLTEALKAGAHKAVWQAASAALPALLAADPRPGLADLIGLAADALDTARVDGVDSLNSVNGVDSVDGTGRPGIAGLAALAAKPGRTRLAEAARRLAALMP
jgi:hypothetical protein